VFGGKKKKAMSLMESGTKAVGTITDVRDTGQTMNDDPRVKMTFRIEPLDGSTVFDSEKTSTVSRVRIPQVGQRYPVWFDPEDHTSFAYATADDDNGRRQIVALFGDAFGADGSAIGVAAVAAPAAAPAAPAADPLDRLKKLEELRASGTLTEEEFAAQKAKVLGQM